MGRNDLELLDRFAVETCSGYCGRLRPHLSGSRSGTVPVSDVMRWPHVLPGLRRPRFGAGGLCRLSEEARARLTEVDYAQAERACPQGLAIAKLMREASRLLA